MPATPRPLFRKASLLATLLLTLMLLLSMLWMRGEVSELRHGDSGPTAPSVHALEQRVSWITVGEVGLVLIILVGLLLPAERRIRTQFELLRRLTVDLRAKNRKLALVQREASRLAAIVRSTGDAILSIGPDETIASWNAGAEQLFAYPWNEAIGRSVWDLVPEGRRDEMERILADVREGNPRTVRGEGLTRNGDSIHLSLTLSPVRQGGELTGVSAIARDITERVEKNERLRELALAVSHAMPGVAWLDADGRFAEVNRDFGTVTGRTLGDLLGQDVGEAFAPNDRLILDDAREVCLERGSARFEIAGRSDGGEMRALEALLVRRGDRHETPTGFHLLCRDITERRQSEQALRDSRLRYALAAEGSRDILWDWDLESGQFHLSDRWRALTGAQESGDVSLEEWLDRVHPDDVTRLREELNALRTGVAKTVECEHRIRDERGEVRWLLCRGAAQRKGFGRAQRVGGSMTDVTQRRLQEETLRRSALYDDLTGLPNRGHLLGRIEDRLACRRRREDGQFAVLFLDLDRFKLVNDSWGHAAGDELLRKVSERLLQCVRPRDLVARLGGDEYAILLDPVHEPGDAIHVTERIRSALREPFHLEGHEFFTAASIGIATGNGMGETADEVLRNADTAMYEAKKTERGSFAIFHPGMQERARRLLELGRDLRHALDRKQIELRYDPIVSLTSGSIRGFEAMMRWRHPHHGTLGLQEMVSASDDPYVLRAMEDWSLRESCALARDLNRDAPLGEPLSIHVGVSAPHLRSTDLTSTLDELVERAALNPGHLHLEIPERALTTDESASGLLHALHERGFAASLEQFGTGFTPLASLHSMPLNGLKIDASFTRRLKDDQTSGAMVRTIVNLADQLSLDVTAAGIEKTAQLSMLRELRCGFGQGPLFSKALTAGEARELLANPSW